MLVYFSGIEIEKETAIGTAIVTDVTVVTVIGIVTVIGTEIVTDENEIDTRSVTERAKTDANVVDHVTGKTFV